MLDLNQLSEQFRDFNAYQVGEQALIRNKLKRALETLRTIGDDWVALNDKVTLAHPSWLVAGQLEAPGQTYHAPSRPTPITVVATDGSQIYPDRHIEPHCYLLNISRIAFQYGTMEQPLMESVPRFEYRRDEFEDEFDQVVGNATAEVVSALRDEFELEALYDVAVQAQIPHRPLVALADGTLIRWMLRGMRDRSLEQRLIDRYASILSRFQEASLPLCSYISMPGNTEVVNLLRVAAGECDRTVSAEESLEGLLDRWIFERILGPGERSAMFLSASRIQQEYGNKDRICYFYVHITSGSGKGEIGRVEVPEWLATEPSLVDLVHATIVSECDKGEGYPMILSEAHEQAVIRARERDFFFNLIEREMQGAGLKHISSRKQASKRRPLV